MSSCRAEAKSPQFGAMGEARALQHPWTRRRRRGLRALPLRLLALMSLGLVLAAAWWEYQQWEFRGATVPKVAAAAAGLPQEPAPRPAEGLPGVLDRAVETVAFPDFKCFGWRATGARTDDVAGRTAVTVYYARGDRQLRYTIVSGTGAVGNARWTSVGMRGPDQVKMTVVLGAPDTMTLVFKRLGRTVVLTAPGGASDITIVRMAKYRAGGRLAF
jgi:hypothetical protein